MKSSKIIKNIKLLLSLIVFFSFSFITIETIAATENILAQGETTNIQWKLDDVGTLTITGNGRMPNWQSTTGTEAVPWVDYRDDITAVDIGYGITSIGNNAFYLCSTLTTVSLPPTLESIGDNAFRNTVITSINIPESVSVIGWYAFESCRSLTSVIMPSVMTTISRFAFQNCTSLEEIIIPQGIIIIDSFTFSGCSSLTSINIPNSVKTIGTYAFSGCSSLPEINISAEVSSIDIQAFKYCYALERIIVDSSNMIYCSMDGVLFLKDMNTLLTYPAGKKGKTYSVPTGVVNISSYAFSGVQDINNVELPEGIETIGYYAFGDSSISSINFPSTLTQLGGHTFANCYGFRNTDLTIPGGIKTIEEGVFSCAYLHNVIIEEGVRIIKTGAFFLNNAERTTITLPTSVKTIEMGAISSEVKIKCHRNSYASAWAIAQGNPLEYICEISFIVHSASLEEDGYMRNECPTCGYIEENEVIINHSYVVNVPQGTQTIEQEAFSGVAMEEVVLPLGIKKVESLSFSNCNNLYLVVVQDPNTVFMEEAFKGSSNFVLLCPEKSKAKEFAQQYGIPFVLVK